MDKIPLTSVIFSLKAYYSRPDGNTSKYPYIYSV